MNTARNSNSNGHSTTIATALLSDNNNINSVLENPIVEGNRLNSGLQSPISENNKLANLEPENQIAEEKSLPSQALARPIQMMKFTYLPPTVDLADLQANGKFFTDAAIKKIKETLRHKPDGRYSKHEIKQQFGVIKLKNQLFGIYKGARSGKTLPAGNFGKPKFTQELTSPNTTMSLLKIIQTAKIPHVNNELNTLKIVGQADFTHPLIIRNKESYKGVPKCQFITDLHPGVDLYDFLTNYRVPPIRILDIAIYATFEAERIHELSYVHRDIKLENYVVNYYSNEVKLIDFGLALTKSVYGYVGAERNGTPEYAPPEIINADEKTLYMYSEETDVYSLGVMFAAMFGIGKVEGRMSIAEELQKSVSLGKLVNDMIAAPGCRPSLGSVHQYLLSYRHDFRLREGSTLKISLINLDEILLNIEANLHKNSMLDLQEFTGEVYFLTQKTENAWDEFNKRKDFYKVMQIMYAYHIIVRDMIVCVPDFSDKSLQAATTAIGNLPTPLPEPYIEFHHWKPKREVIESKDQQQNHPTQEMGHESESNSGLSDKENVSAKNLRTQSFFANSLENYVDWAGCKNSVEQKAATSRAPFVELSSNKGMDKIQRRSFG